MSKAKIADFSWWQFAERIIDENGNEIVTLDFDNIDFVAMKEAGFDGVFLRTSHGNRIDESFELAYELAKDAGLLVGGYHYIYVDSGVGQASVFWGQIEGKDLELGYCFDQEKYSNKDATASEWQVVISGVTAYMVIRMSEDPSFYTSYWMWPLTGPMYMINDKPTKEYKLFVACWHYDFEDDIEPAIPEPWDEWEFWQQTSSYEPEWNHAYSNRTDVGVFNGTPEEMRIKYGGESHPDPDPEPEPNGGDEMDVRLLIVMWSKDAEDLRFFEPETGAEVFYDEGVPDPEPEPDPEPTPEPGPIELEAYMNEGATIKDVTARFEILNAEYMADGYLNFHIKTLKDKMSMQGGNLVIVPVGIPAVVNFDIVGSGVISAPRREATPQQECEAHWLNHNEAYALMFVSDGLPVKGSATTSAGDHPWNWHYGFEIIGSIAVT